MIQARNSDDYYSRLVECFSTIKSINRDDTFSMIGNFRSLKRAINADKEEIMMIGGWGEQKVYKFIYIYISNDNWKQGSPF